jgi:hypothetical protein
MCFRKSSKYLDSSRFANIPWEINLNNIENTILKRHIEGSIYMKRILEWQFEWTMQVLPT